MAVMSIPEVLGTFKSPLQSIVSQITWRNFVLLYALFNLKSVPFSWHVRLFYHLFSRLRFYPHKDLEKSPVNNDIHPIFAPASIMSRTSLFETDYNIHKSNSTYFSDLDIARTVLATPLLSPGMEITRREMNRDLDENGKIRYPGSMTVMLGSVYCTFKREIKPLEKYEMQSKIAGWDEKWLYVLTYFLRPAKQGGGGSGGEKMLFAVAVSKYVMKKGRLTVRPERVLRASGLLPDRPKGEEVLASPSPVESPAAGGSGGEALREVLTLAGDMEIDETAVESNKKRLESATQAGWSWERIEQERLRGLDKVRSFIDIDSKLFAEAPLH